MNLRVYKHYSVGTYRSPAAAHKRLVEISKRYPDRCYVITTNGRSSYHKYKVEQVKQFDLSVKLPPEPQREQYQRPRDYHAAHGLWRFDYEAAIERLEVDLVRPMNP